MSKRPVETAPAPLAKRPAYSSSEADELDVQLQKAKQEAWDARQEAEELRIRTSRESAEAKLALLKEADVQAAVSFMLAPGDVMAAAAKKRGRRGRPHSSVAELCVVASSC